MGSNLRIPRILLRLVHREHNYRRIHTDFTHGGLNGGIAGHYNKRHKIEVNSKPQRRGLFIAFFDHVNGLDSPGRTGAFFGGDRLGPIFKEKQLIQANFESAFL